MAGFGRRARAASGCGTLIRNWSRPCWRWSSRTTWARQVAGAGWAVVDGLPVVDVLTWDDSAKPARPARVRTALICADYDAGMHGWRAHADNRTCRVAWTGEGTASLVMPWDEPSDA
ncbi:hypothetical protein AB0K74_40265 [Streptomyces sp. NPDC056159]|uniref:hypothetical protein n=1 Tax=Streptomyces sp. NPDC056159 TaxID=3155537 RepID=UPI00341B1BC2